MPNRHYPPAYLRYLKARLRNLGRPGFWGTAIFLSVVGLVTWEYWSNPDIFVYKQKSQVASQNPANSSLSEENRAIAADIDNLPVLFNDFDQATPSVTPNNSKENTEAKNSKNPLEDVINKQKSDNDTKLNPGLGVNAVTSPAAKNPFVVQTENLLRTGTVDNNNQFLGLKPSTTASEPTEGETSSSLGIGFTNQTNKNQNSVSISPLQAALSQSTNQKFSSFNGTATQTNALGRASEPGTTLMPSINSLPSQIPSAGLTTGTGYTSTGTNLQQNPYNNLNNGNNGQVVPSNGLTTGTGYTSTGTNLQQNPYNNLNNGNNGQVVPSNGLNTGTGYTSTGTNFQQSPYNNLNNGNNGQVVPNLAPVTPPVTPAAPSNIAPYSSQIPSQGVVTPTKPVGYGNYGLQQPMQPPQSNYGNYGLQQPTQPPQSTYVLQQPTQSNSLYLRQIQEKYRGSGQR